MKSEIEKDNLTTNVINEETIGMISDLGNNISIMESVVKSIENAIDDELNYTQADVENLLSSLRRLVDETNAKFEIIDNSLSL